MVVALGPSLSVMKGLGGGTEASFAWRFWNPRVMHGENREHAGGHRSECIQSLCTCTLSYTHLHCLSFSGLILEEVEIDIAMIESV